MQLILATFFTASFMISTAYAGIVKDVVGKSFGREGLNDIKETAGFAIVEHKGISYRMGRGALGTEEALYIVRTDQKDAKGRGIRFTITDARQFPKLAPNERLAMVCNGPDGPLEGTVGIVRGSDPHNPAADVVRLITIDRKGRFKDLPAKGADCRNDNDGE